MVSWFTLRRLPLIRVCCAVVFCVCVCQAYLTRLMISIRLGAKIRSIRATLRIDNLKCSSTRD